jgi:hypothetical protein
LAADLLEDEILKLRKEIQDLEKKRDDMQNGRKTNRK